MVIVCIKTTSCLETNLPHESTTCTNVTVMSISAFNLNFQFKIFEPVQYI